MMESKNIYLKLMIMAMVIALSVAGFQNALANKQLQSADMTGSYVGSLVI